MNGRAAWFSRILPIHQQQITEDGPSSDLFVHWRVISNISEGYRITDSTSKRRRQRLAAAD